MSPPDVGAPGAGVEAGSRAQGTAKQSTSILTGHGDAAQVEGYAHGFATLRARAARAGSRLYALDGGGYLLTRWTLVRELPSLHAVSQVVAAMGVP